MNQQGRHADISVQTEDAEPASGNHVSLENVHGSIAVPHHLAGFWKQWRAFVGPASCNVRSDWRNRYKGDLVRSALMNSLWKCQ
jgi:hypothetical protein